MQIDSYHLYMTINVCLDSLKVIISNLESNWTYLKVTVPIDSVN